MVVRLTARRAAKGVVATAAAHWRACLGQSDARTRALGKDATSDGDVVGEGVV